MIKSELHKRLLGIQDELYSGSDVTGKKLLAKLISEVAETAENKVSLPQWDWPEGIIWAEVLDDNTFDNGPIVVTLRRIHQYHINGCYFEWHGVGPIQDDTVFDKFEEFVGNQFSWDEGQHVTDSYLLKMLVGLEPEQKVLNAFLNGMIRIEGMNADQVDLIFKDWKGFLARPEGDYGCLDEEESSDT